MEDKFYTKEEVDVKIENLEDAIEMLEKEIEELKKDLAPQTPRVMSGGAPQTGIPQAQSQWTNPYTMGTMMATSMK